MSLENDGIWKSGVWATTVWAGIWREGEFTPPEIHAPAPTQIFVWALFKTR